MTPDRGLISKHGILMVDYANHLQENEGLSRREAIHKAAGIRIDNEVDIALADPKLRVRQSTMLLR